MKNLLLLAAAWGLAACSGTAPPAKEDSSRLAERTVQERPPISNRQQCMATIHDFGVLQGFIELCPQTLLQAAGNREVVANALNAFTQNCDRDMSEADMARLNREHPATRVLGTDGKRRYSQVEAEAFCREQLPELHRILREFRRSAIRTAPIN